LLLFAIYRIVLLHYQHCNIGDKLMKTLMISFAVAVAAVSFSANALDTGAAGVAAGVYITESNNNDQFDDSASAGNDQQYLQPNPNNRRTQAAYELGGVGKEVTDVAVEEAPVENYPSVEGESVVDEGYPAK
jgi:hypothetical protein